MLTAAFRRMCFNSWKYPTTFAKHDDGGYAKSSGSGKITIIDPARTSASTSVKSSSTGAREDIEGGTSVGETGQAER
jgi:hypothetical protein